METNGLTQESLASLTKSSQATVCRALRAKTGNVGPAQEKLFIFAGLDEYLESPITHPRERVLHAFERIWDGSKAHAESIAKVIDAMADLRPQSPKD